MDNELFIQQLYDHYREVRASFIGLQHIVKDIDFADDYTEDEQLLILKEYHALEDYCDALLRRARHQIRMMREEMENEELASDNNGPRIMVATHHCGQDCDCDDACCQAGSPCGRSAVVYDPNESQPVDVKPAITGDSLNELIGWQVVSVMHPGHKCQGCLFSGDDFRCEKKVELVGGYFLCLAPIPNTVTE